MATVDAETRSSADAPTASRGRRRTTVECQPSRSLLTRATGFLRGYQFTLNPYSGCAFGCSYCYARFFAGSAARRDTWGEWVSAKQNAAALLARACASGRLRTGDSVYMSSVTDPYQPAEADLRITRGVLEVLLAYGVQPRLTIQTRSPLVTRDIDLFQRLESVRVNVTISTDSDIVRRRYEPRCPSIEARFAAVEQLAAAGVRFGVSVSPMLPIVDVEAFAKRLLQLNASTYSAQYLKPPGRWFASGSASAALDQAVTDGWGLSEYRAARATIEQILGGGHPLWEGARGYGPV
jgi:DNA repair photolyase